MMKKILLAAAIIIILASAVIFIQALFRSNLPIFAKNASLKTENQTYQLEIADTPEKRQEGLSGRQSLADDRGMVFVFDEADHHSFWMKGMEIPIDIIYLRDNTVVTIYENVPPPENPSDELTLYPPDEPSNRVIELPAGQVAASNINVGDTLELTL